MKKILSLMLSFIILSFTVIPCFAFKQFHNYEIPRVVDNASIFSDEVEKKLTDVYKEWQNTYGTDVVLVSTLDIEHKNIDDYTADFYDYNGYGIGDDFSGIIMCICMEEGNHCYSIITTGKEIERYTMTMINYMYDHIDTYLADEDFDGAAIAFTGMIGSMMSEGNFFGIDNAYSHAFGDEAFHIGFFGVIKDILSRACHNNTFLSILCFSYFLIFIIVFFMAFTQKDAVSKATNAGNYLVSNSFNSRNQTVMFLHSDITKTARSKENSGGSSHGSGGGSSGVSHGGGGGRSF